MMFIKIYSGIVANATRTLKHNIKVTELISKLNDEYLITQLKDYEKYNEIYLWDLGKRATAQVSVGTYLAISCKDNVYIGQIIGVIDDVNGAIGDVVGWGRQFEQPWSNVILLIGVVAIPQEERISSFIKEHDTYPYKILNNFLKIEDDDEKRFFGMVDNPRLPSKFEVHEKPKIEIPPQLKDIVDDIKKLKNDDTHQERAHESLIERFFEYLGYERFSDIKFRVGRVDISINVQGELVVVVEVKKYWNLNIKKDHSVIEQAYNYALVNGARFVIISNGDYYAIFDRDNGRTYMENLKGEFVLSNIDKESLLLINFLKKDSLKSIN
jgi:Holliday junction resolvase-like predicted endonuclease